MVIRKILPGLLISLFLILPSTRTSSIAYSPVDLMLAVRGDRASGEIIEEKNGLLYLNVKPCSPQPVIIKFHKPYAKKNIPDEVCKDTTYKSKTNDRVLVKQEAEVAVVAAPVNELNKQRKGFSFRRTRKAKRTNTINPR
jgi:hypothetical protein